MVGWWGSLGEGLRELECGILRDGAKKSVGLRNVGLGLHGVMDGELKAGRGLGRGREGEG